MAYRYGNRRQEVLFPASIEEYVALDAPVRAYDIFVEALDFGELYQFAFIKQGSSKENGAVL